MDSTSNLHTSDLEVQLTSGASEVETIPTSTDLAIEDKEKNQMIHDQTFSPDPAPGTEVITMLPISNTNSVTLSTNTTNPGCQSPDPETLSIANSSTADPTCNLEPDQVDDNREIHITDLEVEIHTCTSCLQTSLATAIAKAIGHNSNIVEFDKLRHKLKQAKKQKHRPAGYKDLIDQHDLTVLATRLLKQKSSLQQTIRELEQKFFQTSGHLPTAESDAEYAKRVKERNLVKTLLRNLNILL